MNLSSKFLLPALISLFCLPAHSQNVANSIPSILRNERTKQHLPIPGSRVFIIPPQGFVYSIKEGAFEKKEGIIITVEEMPGNDFFVSSRNFTRGNFQKRGETVLVMKDITVNGYAGKFVIASVSDDDAKDKGDAVSREYQLAFGDSHFTVMLLALCPANDPKAAAAITGAIRTLAFDKNKKVGPFEKMPFELNATGTDFRISKAEPTGSSSFTGKSTLLYRQLGTPGDTGSHEPFFKVITRDNYGGKLYMPIYEIVRPYEKAGLKDINIINESEEKVNGLVSLQDEVYGTLNGSKIMIFRHVVIADYLIVYMEGVAFSNFPWYLATFKKISNSIRPRTP